MAERARENHSCVALRRPRAAVTQQRSQVRCVPVREDTRLHVVFLRRFAHDEDLLWLQTYRRVDADVFAAAVRHVHDHTVILPPYI